MNEPRSTRRNEAVGSHLCKLSISLPCYSCAEMIGKRRDKAEYSNSAPVFAKQRRNTQLFRGRFLVRFWLRKNEQRIFTVEVKLGLNHS